MLVLAIACPALSMVCDEAPDLEDPASPDIELGIGLGYQDIFVDPLRAVSGEDRDRDGIRDEAELLLAAHYGPTLRVNAADDYPTNVLYQVSPAWAIDEVPDITSLPPVSEHDPYVLKRHVLIRYVLLWDRDEGCSWSRPTDSAGIYEHDADSAEVTLLVEVRLNVNSWTHGVTCGSLRGIPCFYDGGTYLREVHVSPNLFWTADHHVNRLLELYDERHQPRAFGSTVMNQDYPGFPTWFMHCDLTEDPGVCAGRYDAFMTGLGRIPRKTNIYSYTYSDVPGSLYETALEDLETHERSCYSMYCYPDGDCEDPGEDAPGVNMSLCVWGYTLGLFGRWDSGLLEADLRWAPGPPNLPGINGLVLFECPDFIDPSTYTLGSRVNLFVSRGSHNLYLTTDWHDRSAVDNEKYPLEQWSVCIEDLDGPYSPPFQVTRHVLTQWDFSPLPSGQSTNVGEAWLPMPWTSSLTFTSQDGLVVEPWTDDADYNCDGWGSGALRTGDLCLCPAEWWATGTEYVESYFDSDGDGALAADPLNPSDPCSGLWGAMHDPCDATGVGGDRCPALFNVDDYDADGDTVPEYCEERPWERVDCDGDGVPDWRDNCIFRPNPLQEDTDGDHWGDECDNCTFTPNTEAMQMEYAGWDTVDCLERWDNRLFQRNCDAAWDGEWIGAPYDEEWIGDEPFGWTGDPCDPDPCVAFSLRGSLLPGYEEDQECSYLVDTDRSDGIWERWCDGPGGQWEVCRQLDVTLYDPFPPFTGSIEVGRVHRIPIIATGSSVIRDGDGVPLWDDSSARQTLVQDIHPMWCSCDGIVDPDTIATTGDHQGWQGQCALPPPFGAGCHQSGTLPLRGDSHDYTVRGWHYFWWLADWYPDIFGSARSDEWRDYYDSSDPEANIAMPDRLHQRTYRDVRSGVSGHRLPVCLNCAGDRLSCSDGSVADGGYFTAYDSDFGFIPGCSADSYNQYFNYEPTHPGRDVTETVPCDGFTNPADRGSVDGESTKYSVKLEFYEEAEAGHFDAYGTSISHGAVSGETHSADLVVWMASRAEGETERVRNNFYSDLFDYHYSPGTPLIAPILPPGLLDAELSRASRSAPSNPDLPGPGWFAAPRAELVFEPPFKGCPGWPVESEFRFPWLAETSLTAGLVIYEVEPGGSMPGAYLKSSFAGPGHIIDTQGFAFVKSFVEEMPSVDLAVAGAEMARYPSIWLFGGRDLESHRADMWYGVPLVDGQEVLYSWQKIQPSGQDAPTGRSGHAMAWDEQGRRVLVFGGEGDNGPLNDLWAFDTTTLEWTRVVTSGPSPVFRTGFAHTQVGRDLFIVGGRDAVGALSADVFRLDIGTGRFIRYRAEDQDVDLPAREHPALAFDASMGTLVLFGGHDGISWHNDLWRFDPVKARWEILTDDCTIGECPESGGLSALLAAEGRVHLYPGGVEVPDRDFLVTSTWKGTSTGWSIVSPGALGDNARDCDMDGEIDPQSGRLCKVTSDWWEAPDVAFCDYAGGTTLCAGAGSCDASTYAHSVSDVTGLSTAGNGTVLVTRGSRIEAYDASDPAQPVRLDGHGLGAESRDLEVAGNRAYVAAGTMLKIVDISNPQQLSVIDEVYACGRVVAVEVDGSSIRVATPLGVGSISKPEQEGAHLRSFTWIVPRPGGGWESIPADPEWCDAVGIVVGAVCHFLDCPDGRTRPFEAFHGTGYLAALDDLLVLDLDDRDADGSLLMSSTPAGSTIAALRLFEDAAYMNLAASGSLVVDVSSSYFPALEGPHDVRSWVRSHHSHGDRVYRFGPPGVEIAVREW